MNKKISLGLTVALIIISATATFAITMSVSQRIYDNLMTDLLDRSQMYSAVELFKVGRKKLFCGGRAFALGF